MAPNTKDFCKCGNLKCTVSESCRPCRDDKGINRKIDREVAQNLYDDGVSVKDIAKWFGTSRWAVYLNIKISREAKQVCRLCKRLRKFPRTQKYCKKCRKSGAYHYKVCGFRGCAKLKARDAEKCWDCARANMAIYDYSLARQLRKAGLTYKQVAEKVGCSTMNAWRIVNLLSSKDSHG